MEVVGCLLALALLLSVDGLSFENNAYTNLIIAIHPDVPEDAAIIDQLQDMVRDASPYLYQATGRRAYLGDVTILVPSSWPSHTQYQISSDPQLSFHTADVRVDAPQAGRSMQDAPYVFQPLQCGSPGRYIHLTPAFLTTQPGSYGNKGRVLVHEFAHYRYGVFDEHGDGDLYPFFYLNDQNKLTPTQCRASGFAGTTVRRADNQPCTAADNITQDCFFLIDSSSSTAQVSIMYAQHVASVVAFCETAIGDKRHDSTANNQHNAMCRHPTLGRSLSTWEVIEKHSDMQATPLTAPQPPALPNIRVVRKGDNSTCGRRLVVVLDVSESMVEKKRWFRQNQAGDKLIRDIVPVGSEVGIIVFNSQVKVKQNLTLLVNSSGRPLMATNLPAMDDFGGYTAIGDALQRAKEMLTEGGRSGRGSRILLITDGLQTRGRPIAEVTSEILAAEIMVHTIAYGDDADPSLASLSQSTGGQYGYYSERGSSNLDFGMERLWSDLSLCGRPDQVTIHQNTVEVRAGSDQTGTISVDSNIGNNTVFIFTFSYQQTLKVQITSPNGTVYNEFSPTLYFWNRDLSIIRVRIPGIAQAGDWGYRLYDSSTTSNVTVSVKSESRTTDPPIATEAWVGSTLLSGAAQHVYVYVHKGYTPVLRADVTVTLELPSGVRLDLQPRDHGQAPDVKRNDGVYTVGVPAEVGGQGRYSLSAQVDTSSAVIHRSMPTTGAMPAVPVPQTPTVLEPAGNVTRVTSGGAFDVTNSSSVTNNVTASTDVTPPSPVTDLAVTRSNSSSRSVSLAWTSPGDDLSLGTAHHYDVRMAVSSSQLQNNFTSATKVTDDMLTSGSLTPLPAGSSHEITVSVQVDWAGTVMVFAIKAVDEANNTGFVSNTAVASFTPPTFDPVITVPPPTEVTATADGVTSAVASSSTRQSDVTATTTGNPAVSTAAAGSVTSSTASPSLPGASTGRSELTSATPGSSVGTTSPTYISGNSNHPGQQVTTEMTSHRPAGSEEPGVTDTPEKSQLPLIVGAACGVGAGLACLALAAVLVHKFLVKPKRRPSPSGFDPAWAQGWDNQTFTGSLTSLDRMQGHPDQRRLSDVSFRDISVSPADPNGVPPRASLYPSLGGDQAYQNWGQPSDLYP